MPSPQNPNNSFLSSVLAQMTSHPARFQPQPGTDPALRKQFPQTYGFLGGLMGTAPDQFEGSVLDPLSAQVRAGAEYGFPIGTALQVLPAASFTKGLPVGASTKAVGGMEFLGTPKNALLSAPVSPAGFYSAAEQAALNLQRGKGSGQSFINDLMKYPDVKKDELQATGLLDAFAGKPATTKQEVVDFLQANRVNLGETRLGNQVSNYPHRTADDWQGAIDRAERAGNFDEAQNLTEAWESAEGFGGAGKPKFGNYQLPGGENYREVLLTLPNQWDKPRAAQIANEARIKALRQEMHGTSGTNEIRSEISRLQNENTALQEKIREAPIYKSSHWDEPNVMAHLRLNDRVDAQGKKMTLIEEVQSDWHQAGREQGYQGKVDVSSKIRELSQEEKQYFKVDSGVLMEQNGVWGWMPSKQEAEQFLLSKVSKKGVPDAPMKETWYQTAMRKAVKDAIDSGSERVGITTGARQVDRYTDALRANVDSIEYEAFKSDAGETLYEIAGIKNGNSIISLDELTFDALKEKVGKDMAEKIRNNVGESLAKERPMRPDWMRISGDDLTIGGEGMKKYYDEMYPKYLDKFAKKYGSKVQEGSLSGSASKDELAAKIYGRGETYKNLPSESKRRIDQMFMSGGEPVRYIDITPEMRAAFGGKDKGVPLFGAAPFASLLDEDTRKQVNSYFSLKP